MRFRNDRANCNNLIWNFNNFEFHLYMNYGDNWSKFSVLDKDIVEFSLRYNATHHNCFHYIKFACRDTYIII